jgi:hypothetical protein
MKMLLHLALLTLGCNSLVGQGFVSFAGNAPDPSIEFEAMLRPISSAQNASSGGGAYFSLDQDFFNGGGGFTSIAPPLFANIVDRRGTIVHQAVVLGRVEGDPFSSTSVHWPHKTLTQTQISELMAGEWSVNIGLEGYSGSVIEGPIYLVPEPRVSALCIAALAIFACGKAFRIRASRSHIR